MYIQTENIGSGLLLCLTSGFLLGAFALPQKKIKTWQWENYWASFTLFSAFVLPLIAAYYSVDSFWNTLQQIPVNIKLQVFWFGCAWGISNVGYGLSIKNLGIGISLAIVLGINSIVGTLLPIAIYQVKFTALNSAFDKSKFIPSEKLKANTEFENYDWYPVAILIDGELVFEQL